MSPNPRVGLGSSPDPLRAPHPRAQNRPPEGRERGLPAIPNTFRTSGLNRKLKYRLKCWWLFGRFPAKLGPKTPLNGSGSKNGAERTYNQPRRPIQIPFRDQCLFDHKKYNLKSSQKSYPEHDLCRNTLRCFIHGAWAGRKSSIFGVWAAPAAPKHHSGRWGAKTPLVGMVFGAPGAAQTPKINDFRPAQNSCIKNPKCTPYWPYWRPSGRRDSPPTIDDSKSTRGSGCRQTP